jgi:beta-1,2-rhamnosyltransferase WsaF-like protein
MSSQQVINPGAFYWNSVVLRFCHFQYYPLTCYGNLQAGCRSYQEWAMMRESDAAISTLWTTAYAALRFNNTRRKFCFVQDYESLFYPAGSIYALVEATYRLGYGGICNT